MPHMDGEGRHLHKHIDLLNAEHKNSEHLCNTNTNTNFITTNISKMYLFEATYI